MDEGTVVDGFCYSYLGNSGKEQLLMASFGRTRSLAKRRFGFHNSKRKEIILPYKRYEVQVIIKCDAPVIEAAHGIKDKNA
jgi:hypothetical protein